jgi:hypothetical protein
VANALGFPDIRLSVIQHPLGELGREQVEQRSRQAAADIMNKLLASTGAGVAAASEATPRLIDAPGTWEEVIDDFYARGWTDGLPIVPPESGKVARFVAASGMPPDSVIGVLPPRMGIATVESVAANAVMAGCVPESFPVVLAAVRAVCDPEFNLLPMQATTNPVTPLIIVNGPVAKILHINAADNVFGQGWRANATIGRALRFVLMNVGGGIPGTTDKACHGQPGKFSFCIAENEDRSPWEPLHVERGFSIRDSTVSVIGVTGTQDIIHYARTDADKVLSTLVRAIPREGYKNLYSGGEPLLVFGPEQAAILGAEGLSKKDVKRIIFEGVRVSVALLNPETVSLIKGRRSTLFSGGDDVHEIPIADREDDIQIIVAGGVGNHSVFIPTWGDTRMVTVPVEMAIDVRP